MKGLNFEGNYYIVVQDVEWTDKLVEYMKEHNMFDTEEGKKHRLLILGKLNELMKNWIIKVSIEKVSEECGQSTNKI